MLAKVRELDRPETRLARNFDLDDQGFSLGDVEQHEMISGMLDTAQILFAPLPKLVEADIIDNILGPLDPMFGGRNNEIAGLPDTPVEVSLVQEADILGAGVDRLYGHFAGLVAGPVANGIAYNDHIIVAVRIQRNPVAVVPLGRQDDLEPAIGGDFEIIEIPRAGLYVIGITPEFGHEVKLVPGGTASAARDPVTARAIDKCMAIVKVGAAKSPAIGNRMMKGMPVEKGKVVPGRD